MKMSNETEKIPRHYTRPPGIVKQYLRNKLDENKTNKSDELVGGRLGTFGGILHGYVLEVMKQDPEACRPSERLGSAPSMNS